jgi:hypothetical protein
MQQRMALCIAYIGLIVLSVAMLLAARRFPGAAMGPAGPGFFPQVVAFFLVGLCVLGLVEARRMDERTVRFPPQVLASMAVALAYVGAMHFIGFYPSTFLFCFAVMWLVRDGDGLVRLLFEALALVTVTYLFFGLLLKAYLPTGVLLD